MPTHCFKIVAGIEPFVDDLLASRFNISFWHGISSKDTGEKLKLLCLMFGKNTLYFPYVLAKDLYL